MPYLETLTPDRTLLEDLILLPGAPGYEDRVRDYLREIASKYGRVEEDKIGNLLLHLGGRGPRIVIAAHMDEIGLVVTGIEDNGLLSFRKLGGIDDAILPARHVLVHGEKGAIPGVIGAEPPHLRFASRTARQESQVKPWYELRIDVGAESGDEARELGVNVLDQVTFKKHISYLAGGRYVAARALDDRAGCAALVELARLIGNGVVNPKAEVVLAWTVQEEVGLMGARALNRRLEPDLFIAVDTVTCCHPSVTGGLKLGGGPVLRAIDNAYVSPARLVKRIHAAIRDRGIPVQVSSAGGGTDAAAFHVAGVPSIAISSPLKYTHSLVEKMSLSDYANWVRSLAALVEEGLEP
ncbi:MAG: M42 family metallopeptidase [Desulfurococcales archaeon]|nr:M42 family metallopeptidase [Desulfurococcales archaeon]